MPLLDELKSIVLQLNEASDHMAVLEVVPNNTKARVEGNKILKQVQIDVAKLINKIQKPN